MNSFLLNRQLGSITPQAFATAQNDRLVRNLQAAPDVTFSLQNAEKDASGIEEASARAIQQPHPAGVNGIAIDRFEGR